MTEDLPAPSDRNFLFYDTEDGTTRVQLLVDGGNGMDATNRHRRAV